MKLGAPRYHKNYAFTFAKLRVSRYHSYISWYRWHFKNKIYTGSQVQVQSAKPYLYFVILYTCTCLYEYCLRIYYCADKQWSQLWCSFISADHFCKPVPVRYTGTIYPYGGTLPSPYIGCNFAIFSHTPCAGFCRKSIDSIQTPFSTSNILCLAICITVLRSYTFIY